MQNKESVKELIENAMNDWPTKNLVDLTQFENEVSIFINGLTNLNNLQARFAINDVSENAWKLESLASLIEAIKLSEFDSLKELLEK